MHGEIAATKDGKILGVRVNVIADHGAFNATAQPTQVPGRLLPRLHRLLRPRGRALQGHRRLHEQGARAASPTRCSFRITEAVYLVERMVDVLAHELGMDPAELRLQNFIQPEQFPYEAKTGWVYDSGDYEATMRKAHARWPATTSCAASRPKARERGELMGIGVAFFTEAVGAGPRKHMDIARAGHERRRRAAHPPDRQGRAAASACRPRARATRRRSRRSSPRSSASRRRTSRWCTATPTARRSGSAPTAAARRRCRARPRRSSRARCATRRA